ncbi:hypothetical protein EV641_10745 [Rhodococcus sp. SMB37]|uniref:hypothetical protein n=1 Tax=Rhodococcus sp. SMB37 TaxID=2512213 RepID=UPI0006CFB6AD|nr:hypothetical protein [Rhodococcus sp. SMB37]TCN52688.1 hypothetical protein EV641_10745 [Rhodococcus sp. SMB37]
MPAQTPIGADTVGYVPIMTPTWEQVRGSNYCTMVHAVKSPNTGYATMGASPTFLLRAYDVFPPRATRGFDDQGFVGPSAPRAVRVRGRDGWEVRALDQRANQAVSYVFDAELGIALRWQRGGDWMELESPTLDGVFDPALFSWTGPARPAEDDIAKLHREHEERQRALAGIPQALPTWLPMTDRHESANPLARRQHGIVWAVFFLAQCGGDQIGARVAEGSDEPVTAGL